MPDVLSDIHFLRPLWLLSVIPSTALLWYLLKRKTGAANWQRAISESLLQHLTHGQQSRQSRLPLIALWIAWLLAALALAGPTWSRLPQPVYQRQDALVIVLDLSLSMLAEDIKPSRLVRARHKILDLLEQRSEGLTALVAYSGDAHVVTPLTDDAPTIANLVPALSPLMMPVIGSNPSDAVKLAEELLVNAGIRNGRLLLITDGVTDLDAERIGRQLSGRNVALSIMGVGTSEGAPIPADEGYLKDNDGNIIIPRLQRPALELLAANGAGRYTDTTLDDSDLRFLLRNTFPAGDEFTRLSERQFDVWRDRGGLIALLIIPFAALAFRRGWLLTIALPILIFPEQGMAFEWQDLWKRPDQRAAQQLEAGESDRAARTFRDPSWRGSAHYRAGNYEQAAQSFSTLDTPEAHYNRGNALARAGKLQEAISAYDKALEQAPDLGDARFNRELVERALQQQQQQQQQQQSDQKQQDGQQSSDQQQNGQRADDQSQSPGQHSEDNTSHDGGGQNTGKTPREQQADNSAITEESGQKPRQKDQQPSPEQMAKRNQDKQSQYDPSKETAQQARAEQIDDGRTTQQRQAMEQWLRRVPDDPSGLLRRKFHYESTHQQQTQQQDKSEREQPQW